jgi:class 3 adenylate cyclase
MLISGLVMVSFAVAGPIVGGWGKANPKEAQVLEAVRFAVAAEQARTDAVFKLVSVVRAEQQVVAGMNYRFCLRLQRGKSKTALVQVYRNLAAAFSLTSWAWGACQP